MKIPNMSNAEADAFISLARIVSEDSQLVVSVVKMLSKSSKDS